MYKLGVCVFVGILLITLSSTEFICEDRWPNCALSRLQCSVSKLVVQNCLQTCGKCVCGIPEVKHKRIIGGGDAITGSWPWQVALINQRTIDAGDYFVFCGGSLISPYWVLTASHCVNNYVPGGNQTQLTVALGFTDIKSLKTGPHVEPSRIFRKVERIVHFNPYWTGKLRKQGDISLLKLETPVPSNKYIQPVCLPSTTEDPPDLSKCYTTGWGRRSSYDVNTKVLQQVSTPFVSQKRCLAHKDKDFVKTLKFNNPSPSNDFVCAGRVSPDGNVTGGTCTGDSGGPFVCEVANNDGSRYWQIHGVTSWGMTKEGSHGDRVCDPSTFSIQTRVNNYRNFIYNTLYPPKCVEEKKDKGLSYYEMFKKKMNDLGIEYV